MRRLADDWCASRKQPKRKKKREEAHRRLVGELLRQTFFFIAQEVVTTWLSFFSLFGSAETARGMLNKRGKINK